MNWPQAIRDILVTLLVVICALGMFTNTLEILLRGWPGEDNDDDNDDDGAAGGGEP